MYDPNIDRWVAASLNTYLSTNSLKVPVYLNSKKQNDKEWCEIRVDGPTFENYEYCSWKIHVTVNLLITSFCDVDQYRINRLTGIFGSMLDRDICCFKYGNEPQDDGVQFLTLQRYESSDKVVDIVHFGLITPESKFKRSCVESSYTAWFDGISS